MKNKKINIKAGDIVLFILCLVFMIGIRTFFSACGPKEDGSFMTCHWAGQALSGLAAALLVQSVIHTAVPNPAIKAGVSLAMIPTALVSLILPGNLIHLCMMDSMHCNAVMKPCAIVLSALITAAALAAANVAPDPEPPHPTSLRSATFPQGGRLLGVRTITYPPPGDCRPRP